MNEHIKLAVIIPAYNEEDRIGLTVAAVRGQLGLFDPAVVVVVDDGSTDETFEAAREAGARVISLPANAGKGEALNAGCEVEADYYVFLDADLEESAGAFPALVEPLLRCEADLTVAVLPHQKAGGGSGAVVRLAREGIARRTGEQLGAPLSGQRGLTRSTLQAVRPFASGFGVEVAMTVKALRAGLRVVETPVEFRHRVTGRDFKARMHRLRQYLNVWSAFIRLDREEERKSR